jgi:hypothetical protein
MATDRGGGGEMSLFPTFTSYTGPSWRDQLAAMAMEKLAKNCPSSHPADLHNMTRKVAQTAYAYADAMIEASEEEEEEET